VASGHDITDPAATAELVDLALSSFGALDIVVNNAGFTRHGGFEAQDDATFRSIIDAHLFGTANVTREAWPHMIAAGYGRVVMTTSAIGLWGAPGASAYAAAKAGVAGLARSLSIEGAAHGIKVNSVAPAAETRMSADRFSKPGARTWRPELVAPAVTYLSHHSCALNGAIVSAFSGLFATVEVVQYRGHRFDARGEVSAEDFAAQLGRIADPRDGVGFSDGHIDALGTPLGTDLSAAATRDADARRSR
jgi:NAD(P)-dependent dehydrogenase (short-subunit alcohol dehydrogenase family)